MNGIENSQYFDPSYESYFQGPVSSSPNPHPHPNLHLPSSSSFPHMAMPTEPSLMDGSGNSIMRSSSSGSSLHLNISAINLSERERDLVAYNAADQQAASIPRSQNMASSSHRANALSQFASHFQADMMLSSVPASSPHSAGASPSSDAAGLTIPASPSINGRAGKDDPYTDNHPNMPIKQEPNLHLDHSLERMGPPVRSFSNHSIKSATASNPDDSSTCGPTNMQAALGQVSLDDPLLAGQQSEADLAAEKRQSSKFVYKLFRMVSDPDYQHLISWNRNGTSVMVCNFDEFAKEVLGKHFKHSNFSSFIRQLNMYGFYKVNKTPRGHRQSVDTQVWEFSHPKFLRARPDLLDDIRRKVLDSEHARVEARDLQYSVSVGQMQLRQQVEEMQFRLDEVLEQNMALHTFSTQLRDVVGVLVDHIQNTNDGNLALDVRIPTLDMPSPMPPSALWTPQIQDGPPIFVTEPELGMPRTHLGPTGPAPLFGPQVPFDLAGPVSRRVSQGSLHGDNVVYMPHHGHHGVLHAAPLQRAASFSEAQMLPPHYAGSRPIAGKPSLSGLAIDTLTASSLYPNHASISPTSSGGLTATNAGLGMMSVPPSPLTPQHSAMNTPLPPSPAPNGGTAVAQFPPFDGSPFLQNNGFSPFGAFPNDGGCHIMVGGATSDGDDYQRPNAKAMRTPLKRTASSGPSHQGTPVMMQHPSMGGAIMQPPTSPALMKRKSPV